VVQGIQDTAVLDFMACNGSWISPPKFALIRQVRIEGNVSRQASASREAYEEAGLKVRITGFLADSNRSQSYTRYYLAQRVSGHPARMGWESQAVHLVPRAALVDFLTHPSDLPLLHIILGLK
jgi:8-oxo-dGTP pyrophosphatase MutT (NUDIX family)